MVSDSSWYRFSAPIILEVEGKDTLRYLNARLSNDIRKVTTTEGIAAAALSPQGRVEGIFSVMKDPLRNDGYYLWCAGGDSSAVKKAFTRYIVADRVQVHDRSSEYVFLHLLSSQSDLIVEGSERSKFFIFSCNRLGTHGVDVVLPLASLPVFLKENRCTEERLFSEKSWNFTRALKGKPSFPEEVNEQILLPESALTDVVSYTKGCYAGQEVVEKVDARGKAPRILMRYRAVLECHCDSSDNNIVGVNEENIGSVVTSWSTPTEQVGFALIKMKFFAPVVEAKKGEQKLVLSAL